MSRTTVVRLDADTVRALEQLKAQIDASLPPDVVPPFTLPALARHAIRKHCEANAAPIPNPCLTEQQVQYERRRQDEERDVLRYGEKPANGYADAFVVGRER